MAHSNGAVTVDNGGGDGAPGAAHGDFEDVLQPIPESARNTRVGGQFWIWAGANIAPINWVLGALGIHWGLGMWDVVAVIAIGNFIGMSMFGFFVLLGQRTGATGMVLSRAAFGRKGAYLPTAIQAVLSIGWSAVNTWIVLDLVMALFGKLGWVDPNVKNEMIRIAVAAVIMLIQVTISWLGYRAIAAFERWTVPPTLLVLISMSVVAWFFMNINWGYAGPPGKILVGWDRFAVMSAVMTTIGIGWGVTWFTYAADYSRFVSHKVTKPKLYLASAAGQFIPTVWLGLLGATLATKNAAIDPGQLIVQSFGALAIPVLALVIHGPIATNILNIYTFSVATQALDIKVGRRALSSLVGIFSMVAVIFFIYQEDFATVLDTWLAVLVAWVATWGGIMLVHFYWLEPRRTNYDVLFEDRNTKRLPGVNWAGMVAFFVGMLATWLFMQGAVDVAKGPISNAMGGVDLSWLAGLVTAAVIYAVLAPKALAGYDGFQLRGSKGARSAGEAALVSSKSAADQ